MNYLIITRDCVEFKVSKTLFDQRCGLGVELNTTKIVLRDVNSSTMLSVLDFMILKTITLRSLSDAFEIHDCALSLKFDVLISIALDFISGAITRGTCIEIIKFAKEMKNYKLYEAGIGFFAKEYSNIKAYSVVSFLNLDSEIFFDLLSRGDLVVRDNETLWMDCLEWIYHDIGRICFISDILCYINLDCIDEDFFNKNILNSEPILFDERSMEIIKGAQLRRRKGRRN